MSTKIPVYRLDAVPEFRGPFAVGVPFPVRGKENAPKAPKRKRSDEEDSQDDPDYVQATTNHKKAGSAKGGKAELNKKSTGFKKAAGTQMKAGMAWRGPPLFAFQVEVEADAFYNAIGNVKEQYDAKSASGKVLTLVKLKPQGIAEVFGKSRMHKEFRFGSCASLTRMDIVFDAAKGIATCTCKWS